jgi:BON domain
MTSDAQLQKDVIEELKWVPCITANQIEVSAANGVVTLKGTVPTYAEKCAARWAAKRVLRVTAVEDIIQVKPVGLHENSDAEIAAAVAARAGLKRENPHARPHTLKSTSQPRRLCATS